MSRIEAETVLLPELIAEGVCAEVWDLVGQDGAAFEVAARHLSERAEAVYTRNTDFARKLRGRGNSGRDLLWAFMRHWLAGYVKRTFGTMAFSRLPPGFANGEPRYRESV